MMRGIVAHGLRVTMMSMLFGCAHHRSEAMPAQTGVPIAASVRREIIRLDGRHLSPDALEHIVSGAMTRARVPALGLAIINHGEIVYMAGFGYRDVEHRLPLTDTSVMYAASLTKAMFAHLTMQLVDDGTIALDTPIARYLPKPLPQYEKYADLSADPRWRRITPRMLLSHTSGLPNWRFVNADGKLDLKFEPGVQYSYSGEGINLLQFVIEQHTGKNVGDLMRTRVFDRFGMTRTSMTWQPSFQSELAYGYDSAGNSVGHNERASVRAAGSADTDLADIARFIRGVLRGDGSSDASRRAMLAPQIRIRTPHEFPTPSFDTTSRDDAIGLAYGLGWGLFESPYGRAFFKEGHDDVSWRNYVVAFDEPKSAIVLLSSSANAEPMFPGILAEALGDTFSPAKWMGYAR
jgi:CubicO group peptidase (beta-lactamase class C family)